MHRFITVMTLCVYCFWIAGCATTTKQTIIRDELQDWKDGKIIEVMLDNGDVILFDNAGGRYVQRVVGQTTRPMIVGYTWDKKTVEVDAERVLDAQVEKSEVDAGRTILFVFLGVPAIALTILILIFLL